MILYVNKSHCSSILQVMSPMQQGYYHAIEQAKLGRGCSREPRSNYNHNRPRNQRRLHHLLASTCLQSPTTISFNALINPRVRSPDQLSSTFLVLVVWQLLRPAEHPSPCLEGRESSRRQLLQVQLKLCSATLQKLEKKHSAVCDNSWYLLVFLILNFKS